MLLARAWSPEVPDSVRRHEALQFLVPEHDSD